MYAHLLTHEQVRAPCAAGSGMRRAFLGDEDAHDAAKGESAAVATESEVAKDGRAFRRVDGNGGSGDVELDEDLGEALDEGRVLDPGPARVVDQQLVHGALGNGRVEVRDAGEAGRDKGHGVLRARRLALRARRYSSTRRLLE